MPKIRPRGVCVFLAFHSFFNVSLALASICRNSWRSYDRTVWWSCCCCWHSIAMHSFHLSSFSRADIFWRSIRWRRHDQFRHAERLNELRTLCVCLQRRRQLGPRPLSCRLLPAAIFSNSICTGWSCFTLFVLIFFVVVVVHVALTFQRNEVIRQYHHSCVVFQFRCMPNNVFSRSVVRLPMFLSLALPFRVYDFIGLLPFFSFFFRFVSLFWSKIENEDEMWKKKLREK